MLSLLALFLCIPFQACVVFNMCILNFDLKFICISFLLNSLSVQGYYRDTFGDSPDGIPVHCRTFLLLR